MAIGPTRAVRRRPSDNGLKSDQEICDTIQCKRIIISSLFYSVSSLILQ